MRQGEGVINLFDSYPGEPEKISGETGVREGSLKLGDSN